MHDLGRAVIYITHWEIIFSSENTESQNVGCIGYHCMRIVYAPRVITYILMFGMVCWFGQQCATFIHQNPPCSLTEEHSYCHQDMPRNWAVTWFPNKKIHSNTNCSWSGWRLAMEDFQFFLISQRAVWKKKKNSMDSPIHTSKVNAEISIPVVTWSLILSEPRIQDCLKGRHAWQDGVKIVKLYKYF